jgi:hypothetical protein
VKQTVELTEYTCGDCRGNLWHLAIGHRSDGVTQLIIVCADPECVARKREELGVPEDEMIVWNELNITGQGYDAEDLADEPKILN